MIDDCIRDCHHKNFSAFDHLCVCAIKLTNIGNNEIFNLTISGKSLKLYELNQKITLARQKGSIY